MNSKPQQKEFSIDELVENADVPEQMPTSRELPWYIDVIQKPATHVLLYACTAWDWIKQKTHHVIIIFWHKQEKNHVSSQHDNVIVLAK
jgi:hypothetical protein